jgi:hypothetical protein
LKRFKIFLILSVEINILNTKNDKNDSGCFHCSAELQKNATSLVCTNNHSNLEHQTVSKIVKMTLSRPSSPVLDLNQIQNTKITNQSNNHFSSNNSYQTYTNYLNPTFAISNKSSSARKKIIKLQDCSTWLSISNGQKNSFSPVLNSHPSNTKKKLSNSYYLADAHVLDSNGSINRINVLLNRKNNRANT